MSLPTTEPLLPDDSSLPPARRRRRRRLILPSGLDERSAYLNDLSRQLTPSFDFFLLSILSGLILGIAILLDQPPLYLLAAVVAPFLSPVMGICLATVVGSPRFFFRSLASLLISSALVLGMGVLAGIVSHYWQPGGTGYQLAVQQGRISLAGLLVAGVGGLLSAYLIARNPHSLPLGMNVLLAYALYLPVGVTGFILTNGQIQVAWFDAMAAWLVNLAAVILLGSLTFTIVGLRPQAVLGFFFGGALVLVCMAAAFGIIYYKYIPQMVQPVLIAAESTQTDTLAPTLTATSPPTSTLTPTRTPTRTVSPTVESTTQAVTEISRTPTRTPSPTLTPSKTGSLEPSPTPVWAVIQATEGNGAVFRTGPYFAADPVTDNESLLNGTVVQLFEEVSNTDGVWRHVRLPNKDLDGWVLQSLMVTATPKP